MIQAELGINKMTQIQEARMGNITAAVRAVSEEENISLESLAELIAKGEVVIPLNPNHGPIHAVGIGKKLPRFIRKCS